MKIIRREEIGEIANSNTTHVAWSMLPQVESQDFLKTLCYLKCTALHILHLKNHCMVKPLHTF